VAQHGTLILVLLAPLAIGGAPAGVQVALAFGMLLTTMAWALSRHGELRLAPFVAAGLVAVLGTLLQLLPLPAAVIDVLSPRTLAIRSDALGQRPALLPISLDTPGTVLAALRALSCAAIVLVIAKAVRWRGRTMQVALPLALGGGLMALLSFAQRWFGAKGILGLYEIEHMPGSGFFGTFVNGNHAASFFGLCALLAIGCMRELEGRPRLMLGAVAFLCGLAVFSTGSRMGLIGLAAGLFLMGSAWLVVRLGHKRGLLVSAGVAVVGVPVTILLALSQRRALGDGILTSVLDDQKLRGWKAALAVVGEYPWTGVGRGAFEGPAAGFRPDAEGVRLVFPENLLLQMLSEWGIPITIAVSALFIIPTVQVVRRLARWEPVYQGAACGVAAVLIHELADFGLELPGVAFPTALALGLCAGRLQMSETNVAPKSQRTFGPPVLIGSLVVWAGLLIAGTWAAPHSSEVEGAAAGRLSRLRTAEAGQELKQIALRHPADHHFQLLVARQALHTGSPDGLRHLNRAMQLFPNSAAAHLLAFHTLGRRGLRSQAAVEYRLAVQLGHPFSYAEVVGMVGTENVHRAVPQRPTDLLDLANAFAQAGRHAEAEAASGRAVDLGDGQEAFRIRRMEIALTSGQPDFIRKAAFELARIAESQRGAELAAEGLARSGELKQARALLEAAPGVQSADGAAVVRSARLMFRHGDPDGARLQLSERAVRNFALADRIAAEQLLAEIADKQGLPDLAAAARTRKRLLERLKPPPAE
jgi:hypothetical protein